MISYTWIDGRPPEPRLKGSEDGGYALHLLVRQHVGGVGHVGRHLQLPTGPPWLCLLVQLLLLGSNLLEKC